MMRFFAQFIRHFLLAVQFFTRIPVTGRLADWVGFDQAMLRASAAHFPGVGFLVGGATAAVYAVFALALPDTASAKAVAIVLSTAFGALLTGAFHEDGLADLADGLGGGFTRERALEIMKDSRIGSYGALALVLALLGKCALLLSLSDFGDAVVCTALLAGHVCSRALPLLTIASLPHVGDVAGSKSKPLAEQIGPGALLAAAVWLLLALGLLQALWPWPPTGGMLAMGAAVALLAWAYMRQLLARRLQGFTGDGLGATQQLCELGFYLGVLLAFGQA
jgi:adenosylcobinamide-GDP ribazoletransferase